MGTIRPDAPRPFAGVAASVPERYGKRYKDGRFSYNPTAPRRGSLPSGGMNRVSSWTVIALVAGGWRYALRVVLALLVGNLCAWGAAWLSLGGMG